MPNSLTNISLSSKQLDIPIWHSWKDAALVECPSCHMYAQDLSPGNTWLYQDTGVSSRSVICLPTYVNEWRRDEIAHVQGPDSAKKKKM